VVPAVVCGRLLPTDLGVRAHGPRHAAAAVAHMEPERAQNGGEEGVVFHAAAAAALGYYFGVQGLGVECDGFVGGVVELEVLEGDVAGVVSG